MTQAVSADELSNMRTDAQTLVLPQTCTIKAPVRAKDNTGSVKVTYPNDDYTGVSCGLAPNTGATDDTEGERFVAVSDWIIRLPYDQTVASQYRVVVGGDTYEVLGVSDDHEFRVIRKAYCNRID